MKFMQGKILRTCLNKLQKHNGCGITTSSACDRCCQWCFCNSGHEEKTIIPKDVPKGHVVIYVGEYQKRFVIEMKLLEHPLFQALLDQAHDVYDYNSKLFISCNEDLFLSVVQCAKSSINRRPFICL